MKTPPFLQSVGKDLVRSGLACGIVVSCLLMVGCSGMNPKLLAPKEFRGSGSRIGGVMGVVEVTGGEERSFWSMDTAKLLVEDEEFQGALVLALERSGLFDSVVLGPADWNLSAVIGSQRHEGRGWQEHTASMLVTYRVTDGSGNLLWRESHPFEGRSAAGAAEGLPPPSGGR